MLTQDDAMRGSSKKGFIFYFTFRDSQHSTEYEDMFMKVSLFCFTLPHIAVSSSHDPHVTDQRATTEVEASGVLR